jgi:SAM-dependent methyltransferase
VAGLDHGLAKSSRQESHLRRSGSSVGKLAESPTAKTNITVLCGDATTMSLPDGIFSSAVCLTVFHHLSSAALKHRLFAEVYRVLWPGGVFAETDSMQSLLMRIFHICDTMVLVDPASLTPRLESAGFRDVKIEIGVKRFRFFARRPFESTPSNTCEEYIHVGP